MIVVRQLPVIGGAGRTIITTACRAGVARRRRSRVLERSQICTTIRITANGRRQRGMRMLLLGLAQQMGRLEVLHAVLAVVVVVRHQQVVRLVVLRAESTVLVRVLGLDVAWESPEQRVQVEGQRRALGHLLLEPLFGTV